jgi:hypothetical protein
MGFLSNIARSEGDPKVLRSGPSSRGSSDELARALGWFSIGLGVAELLAPRQFTRALGMSGKEMLVRSYGLREIGHGILSLSPDKTTGLWSRVGGDALDLVTLASAYRPDNPKRDNVGLALAAVASITLLDLIAAQGVTRRHRQTPGDRGIYRNRSGFPQGAQRARGAAREDFRTPPDMQAAPTLAAVSGDLGSAASAA